VPRTSTGDSSTRRSRSWPTGGAESRGVDLIVIGRHGMSAVKRFLLGSVADRVMRRPTCSSCGSYFLRKK
jgi:hypothetical protein